MYIWILVLNILFVSIGLGDEWKLVKESENLKIYVRKPEGAKYEQIKILAYSKATLSKTVAVLEDVDRHKDWNYSTGDSYMLYRRTYNSFDYYLTLDMPFPVKDRDAVISYTRSQDKNTRVVRIESRGKKGIKEPLEEYIRIKNFYSTYTLSPEAGGGIKIEYFMEADPGGSLPAWVVNLVTTKGPTKTMEALLEILADEKYAIDAAENIIN